MVLLYRRDSVENRQERLKRRREQERARRVSETTQEKEERLRKRRARETAATAWTVLLPNRSSNVYALSFQSLHGGKYGL